MVVGSYSFGQFISDYLARMKYSQRDFANKMDVSPSTINRWKQGQAKPDLGQVVRLSEITGTGVETIIAMLYPDVTSKADLSPTAKVFGQAFDESSHDIQEMLMSILLNTRK